MKFEFNDLTEETRRFMLEEIALADSNGQIHVSANFNDTGNENWLNWLNSAAESHDEVWLAEQIKSNNALNATDKRGNAVRVDAAELVSDGQFNRFYVAALCRIAIETGQGLDVYRAHPRGEPKPESEALIGTSVDPADILEQVRDKQKSYRCKATTVGSGLSLKLA